MKYNLKTFPKTDYFESKRFQQWKENFTKEQPEIVEKLIKAGYSKVTLERYKKEILGE